MTFGPRHYVPVLKVKRGEKRALSLLSAVVRPMVTPLLEIVQRTDKSVTAHLDTAFSDLSSVLRLFGRCFIDANEIAADGPNAANEVFERATNSGIVYTPVTGISRTADIGAVLAHRTNGVALRLRLEEFEEGNLGKNVRRFLARYGLVEDETDLIVDLGAVDRMIVSGVQNLASAFLAEVPEHRRWRTFTLSACAFPSSMGGVGRNSHAFTDRVDWLAWRDFQYARRSSLIRLPTYSDGAVQHPQGVEGFDPRIMPVSASIRYTVPNSWLLIKGESTRSIPPSQQFPTLATRLVQGDLRRHFYGVSHCGGCASMEAAAHGAEGFGSAEVWRRLGTIHHITTVVKALASLPWP